MKTYETARIFLLGMMTATLLLIAMNGRDTGRVYAQNGAMGATSNGIIALSGPDKSGMYLVDPANKQIAYYTFEANRLYLRAARHFRWDLQLIDENDRMSFEDAKKAFAKQDLEKKLAAVQTEK